ncbi:MAG TPA: glycosyltransferase [Thermoanaerobaculia bacterium]
MRIGLQTWGTEGDIRPFVALAGGLSARGHDVTLVVTSVDLKDYSSDGRAGGFRVIDACDTYRGWGADRLLSIKERLMALPARRQLTSMFEDLFEPAVDEMYAAAGRLCRDNDALVGHYLTHPVQLAARKHGRPFGTLAFSPDLYPSRHRPPTQLPNLGTWINPWLWKAIGAMANKLALQYVNRLWTREGHRATDLFSEVWQSQRLTLIASSPMLCPRAADWGGHLQICGFFSPPDKPEGSTLPEELRHFLARGDPPVFLTFGSSTSAGVRETEALFVDAAKAAGCRAVVHLPGSGTPGTADHPEIYRIGYVPYQGLFPHCSLIVHHGGAGTTHCAARAGRPSVVVEHHGDHTFWGKQLRRAGLSHRILHARSVTASSLAAEIRKGLRSPDLQRRAEAFGESMRQENGVRRAVELIEERLAP